MESVLRRDPSLPGCDLGQSPEPSQTSVSLLYNSDNNGTYWRVINSEDQIGIQRKCVYKTHGTEPGMWSVLRKCSLDMMMMVMMVLRGRRMMIIMMWKSMRCCSASPDNTTDSQASRLHTHPISSPAAVAQDFSLQCKHVLSNPVAKTCALSQKEARCLPDQHPVGAPWVRGSIDFGRINRRLPRGGRA